MKKLLIPALLLLSTDFTYFFGGPAQAGMESKDLDFDGVLDHLDQCQWNHYSAPVNAAGCPVKSPAPVEVKFDSDSAQIKEGNKNKLKALVEYLDETPEAKVKVQGYTDSLGTEQHNSRLADMRADAVVDYLSDQGIDKERIETRIYGESKPIASNNEPSGRSANRRALAIVVL